MPTQNNQKPPYPTALTKKQRIDRMLRVDHAGEYGAVRIYQGQLAVFGDKHAMSDTIRHMKAQEDVHLERFNALIREHGTRPTLLTPLWHIAGFALGAGTALLGEKAAMACTEAVETVIDEHYAAQIEELGAEEFDTKDSKKGTQELAQELEKFRQEEIEHRDIAVEQGAHQAPGYSLLSGLIQFGCRAAIKVAERV